MSPEAAFYLHDYGFQGPTIPDTVGANGDGEVFDGPIAETASQWLQQRRSDQGPFCLTVSFVNAHDREYFWGGHLRRSVQPAVRRCERRPSRLLRACTR